MKALRRRWATFREHRLPFWLRYHCEEQAGPGFAADSEALMVLVAAARPNTNEGENHAD